MQLCDIMKRDADGLLTEHKNAACASEDPLILPKEKNKTVKKCREKKNCSMFLDSQMYFEVVHELTCGNKKLFSRFPTFHIRANEVSDKHKPSTLRG